MQIRRHRAGPGLILMLVMFSCAVLLFGSVAALALAGKAETGAAAGDAETREPETILILGDSLASGVYIGLYRLLRKRDDYVLDNRGKVSSGLSRPDFYDWPTVVKQITKEISPDHVLMLVGGNDVQSLRHEGKWIRYGKPEWEEIYRKRIASVLDTLKKSGARVYWIGMPVVRKQRLNRGVQYLNTLYEDITKKKGEVFISLYAVTAGENGTFRSHYKDAAGRMRNMRADDGTHFTMRGYINIARTILAEIEARKAREKVKEVKRNKDQDPAPDTTR